MQDNVQPRPAPLTAAQRRPVYDEDGGWYATAPITTTVRDIAADDPHEGSFLEARLVLQPWDGQECGRYTRVWVSYGTSTAELTPAQARQIARELGDFGTQLLALADHADEVTAAQEDPAGSFFRRHFPEVAAFLADERDDEPRAGDHRDAPGQPWPSVERLAAALPDAVRVAMQEVMPDQYTPELAEQIAADVVVELASERGERR